MTLFLFDKPELSAEEANCLKRLSKYTNLIPIFTKGDCLSTEDIPSHKLDLMMQSKELGVEWFNCKDVCESDFRSSRRMRESSFSC